MKNGWSVECPRCGAVIDDFSLNDEWFCDCGEFGVIQYDDAYADDAEDGVEDGEPVA